MNNKSRLRFRRLRYIKDFILILLITSATIYLSTYYFASYDFSTSESSTFNSWSEKFPWNTSHVKGSTRLLSSSSRINLLFGGKIGQSKDDSSQNVKILQASAVVSSLTDDFFLNNDCSEDPQTLPYMGWMQLNPMVKLSPPFSPLVTTYRAKVTFENILITIAGKAVNCQSEVRLDGKFGPSRPTNYSLGVGVNKIRLVVVDISHTQPWVINVYTLSIERSDIFAKEPKFNPSIEHEICSLKQDCDLRVLSRDSCGLTRETFASSLPSSASSSLATSGIFQPFFAHSTVNNNANGQSHNSSNVAYKKSLIYKPQGSSNWETFLYLTTQLPICNSGSSPGRWVVPCVSCNRMSSCFWSQATWQPYTCRYVTLPRETVAKCFTNKKFVFIGDSTNRGIMHYLMEKVNGSLYDSDKTHDLKIYNNLNFGRTQFSFTYYPKFWLPNFQRPTFDKSLVQLLQRINPVANNSDTILVFGGVQWLAQQHINMLLKALSRIGLRGVKIVMKTLSAGFHQPIQGILSLPLEEQQNLPSHNWALANFAKTHGIEVIDTFNITIARFKEFYPGKCACHFHSIKEFASNSVPRQNQYHVDGHINAVYSEILINRICT